jgi:hypothetical protein
MIEVELDWIGSFFGDTTKNGDVVPVRWEDSRDFSGVGKNGEIFPVDLGVVCF